MKEMLILKTINNVPTKEIRFTKLLAILDDVFGVNPTEHVLFLKGMKNQGTISSDFKAYSNVSITPKGVLRLDALEHKAEQDTKNERQRRFQNKISIAQVFVPLITFVIGILVEHFTGIADLISAAFGW